MDQQTLIDKAHQMRVGERLKSGISALTFFDEPLNDDGIRLLVEQRPDLEELYLMKTDITDACVPHLAKFLNLKCINVNQTNLSTSAVVKLIRSLHVAEWELSPEGFILQVAQAIAANNSISSVSACQRQNAIHQSLFDEIVMEIAKSQSIRKLDIRGFQLSGACTEAISDLGLCELGLSYSNCPSEPLSKLNRFGHLDWLNLSGTQLDDKTLIGILERVSIDSLLVSSTRITNLSIDAILATQKLKAVSFENCQVTSRAALQLAQMRTIEYISLPENLIPKFQRIHGGQVHYD